MANNDLYSEIFRRMLRIRLFDTTVSEMHLKGEIPGSLHTSLGQEAEVVGSCLALRPDDYMVGNHRSHGHPIGKGANIEKLMAELLGRSTGVCAGKGGSMHLSDFSVGSLGETSIVGSGLPVAVGAALGSKMKGLGRVCLCYFGDGASNEGTFHESLNLAAIWRLPVIFLCENNGYAVSTPVAYASAVPDIAARGAAYAIPSQIVDGQDVLSVYEATVEAVDRARKGEGPTLIEAKTYRYDDHAANMGRVFDYRTDDEIGQWRKRDPVALFRELLVSEYDFAEDHIKGIEREVQDEVDAAVSFARASPYPEASEAYTDVFADGELCEPTEY